MPSLDRSVVRIALGLLLLVPLALLAACGDDDPAGPRAATRAFTFDHIAGLPKDSGYVCPPPAEGAVSRLFVGGDGAEMLPDGRFWMNLYVSTWERYPSTQQSSRTVMWNSVGRWEQSGDTLTLTHLDPAPVLGKARLAGDSLAVRIVASCENTIDPLELTLIYKEATP